MCAPDVPSSIIQGRPWPFSAASRWLTVETDLTAFKQFLDEYIYGVRDFNEYLQKCGGLPRLQELRRQEFLLDRT